VFFHQLLKHDGSGYVYALPRVVTFAVAGRALDDRVVVGDAWFLRGLGYAVYVGDEGDNRFPRAVRGDPRRRHTGDAAVYLEAILFEDAGYVLRRLVFLESELAEAEDLIDHLLGKHPKAFDFGDCLALQISEGRRGLGSGRDSCRGN
jgi:hypothetical protein